MMKIDLTDEQRKLLRPVFEQVISANLKGEPISIIAQVYQDGMIVKALTKDQGQEVAKALGGNYLRQDSSAKDRISN